MLEAITREARDAITELCTVAKLIPGEIVVIGCSSSEVGGSQIGTHSSPVIAEAIFAGIAPVLAERGLFLAAQCCEHLNRAVILPREAALQYRFPIVNVLPQPKAGGSFATVACRELPDAVAVESIEQQAAAGLDIGGTLIGMHLRPVAVPVRLSVKTIGEAPLLAARTRPKFVGGSRAVYDPALL